MVLISPLILVAGGVLWILSDKDDQRFFWGGLKFLIPVFLGVGKFGKYIFGSLDLSQDFWGCFSCYISKCFLEIFEARKFHIRLLGG